MEEKLLEPKVEALHIVWTTFIHRFPFPFKDPVYVNFKAKLKEEWYLPNSLQYRTIVSAYFSVNTKRIVLWRPSHRALQSRQIPSKQLECSAPSHESINNCCDLWKSLKEELLWVINTTNSGRFAWIQTIPLLETVPHSHWENDAMHGLWSHIGLLEYWLCSLLAVWP